MPRLEEVSRRWSAGVAALTREAKENPGPFALWVGLHASITTWLFANGECSLRADLTRGRLAHPLAMLAGLAVNGALYAKILTTSPGFWQQPCDTMQSSCTSEAPILGLNGGVQDSSSSAQRQERWERPSAFGASGPRDPAAADHLDDDLEAPQTGVSHSQGSFSSQQGKSSDAGDVEAGCDLALPLRTKYCKRCRAYVLRHDHHCPFLGGCVGLENHRVFYAFLAAQNALCAYGLALNSRCFVQKPQEADWVVANGLPILVALVVCFALSVLAPLLAFQTYLALTNSTTYEVLARDKIWYLQVYPHGVNPFDRGAWSNARQFLSGGLETTIPTIGEIEERRGSRNDWWDNDYYSCCG